MTSNMSSVFFFHSGNQKRWIVAVKMVSEGVDIPRLRVGVFASNVTSELYFRQAVGRFLRMIAGLDEQSAVFYLPADEMLIKHALAIKEEREHYLPEIVKAEKPRANKLAHLTRTDFDEIHRRWIREMNGKPNRDATEEELAGKLEWLQNRISDFYREQTKR